MSPSISVVIPVYNSEKYLNECIDSILNQTFQNFEIITINDGSTDSSLQILEYYAQKHDNIKIINKENEGQGYARKLGLDLAKGDYILFCDSDDFYEPDALEKLYKTITKNKSDIAIIRCIFWDCEKNTSEEPEQTKLLDFLMKDTDFNNFTFNHMYMKSLAFQYIFAPWSKIYSKKYLDTYNDFYFPKNLQYEDVPFHIQVILRAKEISICPHKLYNYRVSNSQSTMHTSIKSQQCFDIFKVIYEIKSILVKEEQLEAYWMLFYSYVLTTLYYYYYKITLTFKDEYYKKIKETLKIFSDKEINELEPWIKKIYAKFSNAETSREFDLLNENEEKSIEIGQIREELNAKNNTIIDLNESIETLNGTLKALTTEQANILNSFSFRIGRAITKTLSFPVSLMKGRK